MASRKLLSIYGNCNQMIRVFPRKTKWTPTDELAFIGDPPLFRPPEQPVRVSCSFTWDIIEAERLKRSWSRFYSDVEVGGPAYDDPGGGFVPGRFIKEGVTITSRGCSKNCGFCLVPTREGYIRELPIRPGYIVQDNNLLACSMGHVERVFKMLSDQSRAAKFTGGIDAELFTKEHADMFRSIRIEEIWFACDYPGAVVHLERVAEHVEHLAYWKRRCYVLCGFNGETPRQAEKRLEAVYDLGFMPMASVYQPPTRTAETEQVTKDWAELKAHFSRPANTKGHMKHKRGGDREFLNQAQH